MRFWDSSALVPLLLQEGTSDGLRSQLEADPAVVVWWGTPVECTSAIARVEREAALASADARLALDRLRRASASWTVVPASNAVRDHALRLLRVHPLRAADALQLAAAIVAADFVPPSLSFITLDQRLLLAAEREGFRVVEMQS